MGCCALADAWGLVGWRGQDSIGGPLSCILVYGFVVSTIQPPYECCHGVWVSHTSASPLPYPCTVSR
jgi:hypothetical protein